MNNYIYRSQWVNKRDPSSSCALTCLGMAVNINPDDLWLAAKQRNWDRFDPETIDRLSVLYRKPYRLNRNLSTNNIVSGTILYGSWTPLGHCVLVTKVKETQLDYYDPLGYFDGINYDFNGSGERENADINTLTKYIGYQGEIWGHLPIQS